MLSSTLAQSLTLGMLGAAFFIAPPVKAASMYSITDIGTLPGYQGATASDINNLGQVVGTARSGTFSPFRAFIWENGTRTDLGTLPGYTASSDASSTNDLGQVVGNSYDRVPNRGGWGNRAFLWSANNGITDLGTLGGSNSSASAINNLGQVVGSANNTIRVSRAFRTAPNSPINPATDDLGIDIGSSSSGGFSGASDINNLGQVVGYISGNDGSFLWDNGNVTKFTIGVGAINDKGQIVGSPAPGLSSAGVLWDNGVITDLGTLGGSGGASDINKNGQIVGGVSTARGFHAYFWENGVLSDLNDLIPANSGWELTTATAINDGGQIVGSGTINGQERAYLLTPLTKAALVPEPNYTFATLVITACSAFYLSKHKSLSK